jgi:pimeloyl-ACP methyl ester carboxylesterase
MSGSFPILLLHGQPGAGGDWDAVRRALPPELDVLAPDRPGWDGRSRALGIAQNADAAAALLAERGIERAVVAGHSLGGTIAAQLAISHPDRVAALVLVAPAANRGSLQLLDRLLALPGLGDAATVAMLSATGAVLGLSGVRTRAARELALGEPYLARRGRTLRSPAGWRGFAIEQRALVAEVAGLEAALGRITAPTTIVAGRDDRMIPSEATRLLARQIPGARLIELEHVGHLLPQLAAEALAGLLAQAACDEAQ